MPDMDTTTSNDAEDVDSKIKEPSNKSTAINDLNVNNEENELYANKTCFSGSVQASSSPSSSSSCSVEVTNTLPTPPDGGWGWVVVFASFMINLIADGVSLSFGILFVDLVQYFGESKGKTAWVGSIFLSMPLLTGPIASYLSDRYGCRKVCIAGALLAAGGFIFSVFSHSLEVLFLTFSIAGLGLALCYVTSIVIVAYYFEKRRSLATGLAVCGTGIGTFIFPPLTMYILEEYAWRGTLLILSGFFLNVVAFGALMRDLEFPTKSSNSTGNKHLSLGNESGKENCPLEDSERLCSSLVQLPTYLCDNLPLEVITELSNKEGGYLCTLLEQYPYLLNSIVICHGKEPTMTVKSSPPIPPFGTAIMPSTKEKSKLKVLPLDQKLDEKHSPNQSRKSSIPNAKLDAAYLCNMRLQRGSITYRGAMLNIRRYRLRASSCPDIYRNSMVTITEDKGCSFFQDLKEILLDMIDLSIFSNFHYTIFCISNFLLYACVDVPYVYIPDHAFNQGVDMESASYLISVLGVLNTLGVIIVGYVGDKTWIDSSLLYSAFIAISGLMMGIVPVIKDYYGTASLVGIYGFTISANYTLVPVIIVNLISMDSFTGAYGLLLLIQGIASLVGPPLAGMLFDMTGNYEITFFCTGICIFISGAMVLPIANTIVCKKSATSSVNSSKESMKQNSLAEKVRFKERGTVNFISELDDDDKKVKKRNVTAFSQSHKLNSNTYKNDKNNETAVVTPLISNVNSTNAKHENGSVYENPFSAEEI